MKRRNFLSMLGYASAGLALPFPKLALADGFEPYTGPLLVTIQANGGWDVARSVSHTKIRDHEPY